MTEAIKNCGSTPIYTPLQITAFAVNEASRQEILNLPPCNSGVHFAEGQIQALQQKACSLKMTYSVTSLRQSFSLSILLYIFFEILQQLFCFNQMLAIFCINNTA